MGRINERHVRYRTKEQIVQDVAFVLNAPLEIGTKWAVLSEVAWVWTEFCGKYEGCERWTKKAVVQRLTDPEGDFRNFRHEHVVPKNVVIKMLLALPSPTVDQVRDICERFLIGVVVTREENADLNAEFQQTMPPEFDDPKSPSYRDPWLRYKRYKIEVI